MLEKIYGEDQLLALILRANFTADGIEFFTPDHFSQQLGYMNRPKGFEVTPHFHNFISRDVELTQEVLFIKSGKVLMDIFDSDHNLVKSSILEKGDVVLLASGGHGFTMLEQSEIIEVKTGPHLGKLDKTRFDKNEI
jgi:hypothetical protein